MSRPAGPAVVAVAVMACALIGACTGVRESRVIMRWDPAETRLTQVYAFSAFAVSMDDGIFVYRRTLPKATLEVYAADGKLSARTFVQEPLISAQSRGGSVYYIQEAGSNSRAIWKWSPPEEPQRLSENANWTDFLIDAGGRVYGFESIYLTRDNPPSAVRIVDLEAGTVVREDMRSYQVPIAMTSMMMYSPIDRKIRLLAEGEYRVVGALVVPTNPPLARDDGRFAAWFGPEDSGTALFVVNSDGVARTLAAPFAEHPIAWAGEDLMVAMRDSITGRRTLRRYDVVSGELRGGVELPQAVGAPKIAEGGSGGAAAQDFAFKPFPSGELIGFSTDRGSQLFHVADGSIEEFGDVPLSSWHISPDGSNLYFFDRSRLEVSPRP